MFKLICNLWVIITFVFACECIYKSKINSKIRMHISAINKTIGLKCYLFMKKYKWLYKFVGELIIIWFIFEWNDKLIINTIAKYWERGYSVFSPFFQHIVTFCVWLSPYGRSVMENRMVSYWMDRFSIGILVVYVLNNFFLLMGINQKISKFIVSSIGIFASWYIMLFLTKIVILISNDYLIAHWGVAVVGFFLIIILFGGIVYGLIYE